MFFKGFALGCVNLQFILKDIISEQDWRILAMVPIVLLLQLSHRDLSIKTGSSLPEARFSRNIHSTKKL